MNLFESVTRSNLRFTTPNGQRSTEDLWTLPLDSKTQTNLYNLSDELDDKLRLAKQSRRAKIDPVLKLQIEVINYIINTREQEIADRAENAQKQSRISELIDVLGEQQASEDRTKSKKDILKEIKKLQG